MHRYEYLISNPQYELNYLQSEAEREWFAEQIESSFLDEITSEYKIQLGLEMAKCQNFDHFLANKFPTHKRYGGEGCESMIAFFLEAMRCSRKKGSYQLLQETNFKINCLLHSL